MPASLSSPVVRSLAVAVLVAVIGLTFVPSPLRAATVSGDGCIETNTYTFDPPLTPMTEVGTVTMTYDVTCIAWSATPSPFSAGATEAGASGSGTFDYIGNCGVALLTGAFVHAVLGGSVVVALNASTAPGVSRKVVVLQPSNPCTDTGGQVSGTGSGPAWSAGLS
jgi:hypothetical protein